MAKTNQSVREFATIGFILLAVLFGMQIMTFIFGNLGSIDNFPTKNVTAVTNETITLSSSTGIGTIADNTNLNFLTWNASLIINATFGAGGSSSNETLIEGTDYTIFPLNGTFGNVTGDWNRSFVTYSVTRKPDAQVVTEETTNDSLQAIGNYASQAGTQFTTLGIAITLVILVAVFLFFWAAFMGSGRSGKSKDGPGSFG